MKLRRWATDRTLILAEQMTGRNPLLDRDAEDQEAATFQLVSHQQLGSCPILTEVAQIFPANS
jgi:hypothetical protein